MTTKSQDTQTNRIQIQLCGTSGCCPVVEINHDENTIVITDDNGGKVTLTNEQWREALAKVQVDA